MTGSILFVDDEPRVLAGYERSLSRQSFEVSIAASAAQAIDLLAGGDDFDVIVSDLRMPGMDGIELLTQVAVRWPDTFRVLLTGAADLGAAVAAVNQAGIFRLLLKPCPAEDLLASLRQAVRLRLALSAEKDLLEQTVTGSVALCMELLATSDPHALRHGERLLHYARRISKSAELDEPWRLQLAAMLSPIGFIALPAELKQAVAEGATLREDQLDALREVPYATHRLLGHIPRLGPVAEIVLRSQVPGHDCPQDLWLEAELLSVLLRLVKEVSEGKSEGEALSSLRSSSPRDEQAISLIRKVLGG